MVVAYNTNLIYLYMLSEVGASTDGRKPINISALPSIGRIRGWRIRFSPLTFLRRSPLLRKKLSLTL